MEKRGGDENLTKDTPPKNGFWTPLRLARFPLPSSVDALFLLCRNPRLSTPETLLEGSEFLSGGCIVWYVLLHPLRIMAQFKLLRSVMRAILSVRPKCSHRCVSLKESHLKPVRTLKRTTRISTEQTSMRERNGLNTSRSKLFRKGIQWDLPDFVSCGVWCVAKRNGKCSSIPEWDLALHLFQNFCKN